MQEKTNYGKIVAVTLAVISAASAICYVIYRLCRNFFTFCDAYHNEDFLEDDDVYFDELDEKDEEEVAEAEQ